MKINTYLAAVAMIGLLPLSSYAFDGHMGMDVDFNGMAGVVSAINGNSVTLTLDNPINANVKVGDKIDVRDRSLASGNVSGTVTAAGNNTLTVKRPDGTSVTINTSASTTIKKDGQSASFADLVAGAMIRARGVFDSATSTLSASAINIFTHVNAGLHLGWFKHGRPNPSPSVSPSQ